MLERGGMQHDIDSAHPELQRLAVADIGEMTGDLAAGRYCSIWKEELGLVVVDAHDMRRLAGHELAHQFGPDRAASAGDENVLSLKRSIRLNSSARGA